MYLNSDVLFSTTAAIPGREIIQHLGILAQRKIILAGENTDEMSAAMDMQYAALAERMNKRAKDIGADAVVGVDFRVEPLHGRCMLLSVTGNAVRLKDDDNAPECIIEQEIDSEENMPEEIIPEEIQPEEKAEDTAWQCIKCGCENESQFMYCPNCGEIRDIDWQCAACGQQNPAEYKFCPGCGKTRA